MLVGSSLEYAHSLYNAWNTQIGIFWEAVNSIDLEEENGGLPESINMMRVSLGKLEETREQSITQLTAMNDQLSTKVLKLINKFVVVGDSAVGVSVSALYTAYAVRFGMLFHGEGGDTSANVLNSTSNVSSNSKNAIEDVAAFKTVYVLIGTVASGFRLWVQTKTLKMTEGMTCLILPALGKEAIEDHRAMVDVMESIQELSRGAGGIKLSHLRRSIPAGFSGGSHSLRKLSIAPGVSNMRGADGRYNMREVGNVVMAVIRDNGENPISPSSAKLKDGDKHQVIPITPPNDSCCLDNQEDIDKYYVRRCWGFVSIKMEELTKDIDQINKVFMARLQSAQDSMSKSDPENTDLKVSIDCLEKKCVELRELHAVVDYIKCQLEGFSLRKIAIVAASGVQAVGELATLTVIITEALQGVSAYLNYVGAGSLMVAKVSAAVSSATSGWFLKIEEVKTDISKVESKDSRATMNSLLCIVKGYQELCDSIKVTGTNREAHNRQVIRNLYIPPDVARRCGRLSQTGSPLDPFFFQQRAVQSSVLRECGVVRNQGVYATDDETGVKRVGFLLPNSTGEASFELDLGEDSDDEEFYKKLQGFRLARSSWHTRRYSTPDDGSAEKSPSSGKQSNSVAGGLPKSSVSSPPLQPTTPKPRRTSAPRQSLTEVGPSVEAPQISVDGDTTQQMQEVPETNS